MSTRYRPNVLMVHYDQLMTDRESSMRKIAARLGITVAEAKWPALVEAASFQHRRANAAGLAPDMAGVIKSPTPFFRRGTSGAGQEVLSVEELARYHACAARLAGPELLEWLRRGGECNSR